MSQMHDSLLHRRVDQLISAQAARVPDAVAAVFGEQSLTYRELDSRSDRVAARLRALGVVVGSLVGVQLERSLDMLVALIAIMKAGGAYVPLDPEFPVDRLAHMVADADLPLVVTQASLAASVPAGRHRKVEIEQLLGSDALAEIDLTEDTQAGGADLVYVLYTSGSTGLPKGVAVEHRNVVNFLLSMQREPGIAQHDRLVAVTTLSFDIAGLELYLPLVTGATVVIAGRDQAADGESLRALLDGQQATIMQATPTTWRLLIEAGWRGAQDFKALCGGEALPRDLAHMLVQRCGQLWNLYGPTETTIWSSVFRVPEEGTPVLIGRPIDNTRIYILDKSGRQVPTGIPGEICIAGAGVARGYLNRPELTAERFLDDPFAESAGERIYRTGDIGRYLVGGNLEYRNRSDNQVKIRGFRVELGEVEAALESHPAIKQAIAKIIEGAPGDVRLVGYILPHAQAPDALELREHLRDRLPHYMVPQHLSIVEGFPLTPNGKVDRAQIAPPRAEDLFVQAHVEPRPGVESEVAEVFREVLMAERVSADASFFDLGGHSILATRAVSMLRKRGHAGATLRMLFESPTASALARELWQLQQDDTIAREAFEF